MRTYLVGSTISPAAGDDGRVPLGLCLDREGIFADGGPPHVRERAAALAVDAVDLVGADDDVGDRGALLQVEDRVAALRTGAGHAAVVHDHASVEVLARGDRLDLGENGRAAGFGHGSPLARRQNDGLPRRKGWRVFVCGLGR